MNERQLAEELGALIDNRRDDVSGQLPAEESIFAAHLLALRDQIHADDFFADALEARWKPASRSPFENRRTKLKRGLNTRSDRKGRLVYAMATFTAALAIVAFAALAVPSLRSLTQPDEETIPTMTAALPITNGLSGYKVASASLRNGFRVMGYALNTDEFAVNLIESAFTSYVNFMSSD
jgi:hypothetical protein